MAERKGEPIDLIERQKAIDALMAWEEGSVWDDECLKHRGEPYWVAPSDVIERLPSAQPERKQGKWIERNPQNSDTCRLIECDQCGFSHIVGFNVPYEHWIENRNFCERCGADMRGEQDG